jgi:hypothetical protein
MSTEIHKRNNYKAAMRVLLISLAALLTLELMTTVGCILINYTCANKTKKKRTIVSNLDACIKRLFYQRIIVSLRSMKIVCV